jgi:Holliday junction resolvase
MAKINSREKGKRFERELAGKLRAAGYPDARRTAQYCGNSGKAYDIEGVPGIAIEAKHREKMALYDWIAQAVRDSEGSGLLPVVMHRKNNAETLVTMRLTDWLEVFREWSQNVQVPGKGARTEAEDGKD